MEEESQVRVRFVTKIPSIRVTETPFAVPTSLARKGLSQVVNHLLSSEKENNDSQIFDFLIDDVFLRTSLATYMKKNIVSDEAVLTIEYLFAIQEPNQSDETEHPDWISAIAVACHPDTKETFIATGCYDGVARIVSRSGEILVSLKVHESAISCIAFSYQRDCGGFMLVTGGKDHCLYSWDVDVQKKTISARGLYTNHLNSVQNVAISSDNQKIVSGSWDGIVRVFDSNMANFQDEAQPSKKRKKSEKTSSNMTPTEPMHTLLGHSQRVSGVHIAENGTISSSSFDGSVKMWDATSDRCLQTMSGKQAISAMSRNNDLIITGHCDHKIRLWDTRAHEQGESMIKTTLQSKHWVSDIKWKHNLILSSDHGGVLKLWDTRSSIPLYTINAHDGSKALAVDFINETSFASGGEDCKLKFFCSK